MLNTQLLHEVAALAGYTIDAATGQDPTNKIRAQRRINAVKADIVSRYGAKWSPNYKEGWLKLAPLYNTGTVTFTQNSITVTGSGTAWTTLVDPKSSKILGGDGSYYKIGSVQSDTSLTLSQPYQGATIAGQVYQIWQDEYRLYPDVWSVGGFVDYFLPKRATEAWPTNMKDSYPSPTAVQEPDIYTVLGRAILTSSVTTGTVSASANTNVWTGVGTTWLSGAVQIEPGFAFVVSGVTYAVKRVNSDTELETVQLAVTGITGLTYSAQGKNALTIRFLAPTTQRIVSYWYYCKDYPFVNDNDEDWIAELFPEVIMNGAVRKDYLDKNDVARASLSKQEYEDSIKSMKVAIEGAYTGVRTLGIYVPPEARD